MTLTDARLQRLEALLGRVLLGGLIVSTTLLAIGLALVLIGRGSAMSAAMLHAGLLALMATPILRVVVSFIEYLRERDWFFAAITFAVLMVLAVTVTVALRY